MARIGRTRRSVLSVAALAAVIPIALAGCGASPSAAAPKYPTHNITFIVPFKPGGGSDQSVRRLQPVAQKKLGVNWNVTYQTGGSGADGFEAIYSAKPNGYTVGNLELTDLILLADKNVGFTPAKFRFVAFTETTPDALVVPKNSPFQTLADFVSYAKAHPGRVMVAGVGSKGKLLVSMIEHATGTKLDYVPVSGGSGSIVTDLEGGHINAGVFGSSNALENAATLRALAVSSSAMDPALPSVPTFVSQGYTGVVFESVWGVLAPPGTPNRIVDILNKAVEAAVHSPSVQSQDKKNGLVPLTETPQQATQFFNQYNQVIQNALKAGGN